jgi:hypothetical protein
MDHTTQEQSPKLCECGCGQQTTLAPHTNSKRGWIKGKPLQFVHGHNRRIQTPQEAFLRYFMPGNPDECWSWQGNSRSSLGYGKLTANNKRYSAHRVSYEIHYGPIPEGMSVCHHCDNPICVNPHHLFLGTQADNMRDASRKNRTTKGSRSKSAKLKESDIMEIRRLHHLEGMPQPTIAKRFNVTRSCIAHVIQGNSWNHV